VKRVAVAAMIVAAGLLVASPAAAHPAPFSYVDLRISAQAVDAAFVLHVFDLGHGLEVDPADQFLDPAFATARLPGLAALITSRLQLMAAGRALTASVIGVEPVPDRHAVRVTLRYSVSALPGSVTLSGVMFPYDPEHQTFVNVYEGEALTQAMIDSRRTRFEYFSGSPQGRSAVVATFLPAGVHHILIGPDHILFLVGLLLLGGTWRRLALIVTGFTVAHSVTLTLAALNLLRPPEYLVEPAIALSIIYVGADNLLKRDGRDMRAWIAGAFGLIHGFGFAGVLRDMDLPARALGWSLFSFNVGVELGQLLIVLVMASAMALIHSRSETFGRRVVVAGSVAVMAAGTYWFVERLMFAGGM
jgi:hydrogenase/urease accessory protein HupE